MPFTPSNAGPAPTIPPGVPTLLRDLIHERTGIYFEDERLDTLLDKLSERVAAQSCSSYLDYYYILKYEDRGREEWLRVMDAFSVQETYFWREFVQIRTLVELIVPAWFKTGRKPLRIWSAACATGEEPFSLAIALEEAGWGRHPISIRASDASEAALARASAGIYRERSFRSLPPELRERYFQPVPEGTRILRERLLPVTFSRANLVSLGDIADLAAAEVIFCRNVFIYFSPEAIRRTVRLFAQAMPDNGHLFVGASESLLKLTDQFELRDVNDAFVYLRKPRTAAETP
jgi:chemotaxis protein methyltransferase CheR